MIKTVQLRNRRGKAGKKMSSRLQKEAKCMQKDKLFMEFIKHTESENKYKKDKNTLTL